MDYFQEQVQLLQLEKEADRKTYKDLVETMPVAERRAAGMTWYPVVIKDTELGHGDYLSVTVERPTHQDVIHNLRFGMSAALFSNYDAKANRVEGIITYVSDNLLTITLRTDELPDWLRDGKLGIDAVFDENSYAEMEAALKVAAARLDTKEGTLIEILLGKRAPTYYKQPTPVSSLPLNALQQQAVEKIVTANELAIVHGPPGTGKTTTLVQAIKCLLQQDKQQLLVTAPSNAAVDLLSEKLTDEGLKVVRVGSPARVNPRQLALTLDAKIAAHPEVKEIKRLKKQATEYRQLARKYKRSFGAAEREQRKALFAEARHISKEVDRIEKYITDDILSKADVITATLVGANHYSVRHLQYGTVVIDEAGQALEPACWIPILKGKKVVMAGDHLQLPPTIKSAEAAQRGLVTTLMEKCVALHPNAVVLLQEQYRMHRHIMGFPSHTFYGGRLTAHHSVAERLLFTGDQPLVFIDTAGCGFEEKWEGTSIANPEEAHFLLKQVSHMANEMRAYYTIEQLPTIAIISPYKHQVEVLKEAVATYPVLVEAGAALSINTIDSFQGQERDAVFISMTRSNTENTIGFLADIRRMNVAMTRAKKKLVVIGDSATLSQEPFYADFIAYTQDNSAYQSAWELMEW